MTQDKIPEPYKGQGTTPMNTVQREKATLMAQLHGHPLEERMEGDIAVLVCPNFRSRWAILADGQTIGSGYTKPCKDSKPKE